MRKLISVVAANLGVVSVAAAHPGHGQAGDGYTLHHYLTEPVHVLGIVGVAMLGAIAVSWWRSTGRKRASRDR